MGKFMCSLMLIHLKRIALNILHSRRSKIEIILTRIIKQREIKYNQFQSFKAMYHFVQSVQHK